MDTPSSSSSSSSVSGSGSGSGSTPQPPQLTKPVPTATSKSEPPTGSSYEKKEVVKVEDEEENKVVKVENGWKTKKEGFIYVSVKGNETQRGTAHGELLADRIIKFIRTYAYYVYDHTGYTIHLFIEMMADLFMSKSSLDEKYKEVIQEIQGIASGVVKAVKDGNISPDTKTNIDFSNTPPRIKLTDESYPPKLYDTSSPSFDKQYVAIDEKVIFLLNGIVSLFYIFPYLEKFLNMPEYGDLKKKPVYSQFLLNESFKSKTDSTPTSESEPKKEEEPSLLEKLLGKGGGSDKCSAFMAVGPDYTKDGGIVYSHITFDDFMSGQFDNIILNLQTTTPGTQNPTSADMLMQTFPGGIFSSTDFFMTSFGFMGTETTLGGFDSFELKAPICFRARKAMQYGKTLDDYVTYLNENNSGDYACTWYIGRVKVKESDPAEKIIRIELGRKFINVKEETNGYFIGFNAAYDPRIRNIECSNDGFYDSRRHQGSRRIRLKEIITQCKERGIKIDEDLAIKIISDHKDSYLDKPNNPCSRTICAHYDEDKREYMSDPARPKPNQPRGAVDAKVGSSNLYKQNQFLAIWGRACGTPFDPETFCKKYTLWDNQKEYLEARPTRQWVKCKCVLVDNVSDATNALVVHKQSVFQSGESDIFSQGSVSVAASASVAPSSPRPSPVQTAQPAQKSPLSPSTIVSNQDNTIEPQKGQSPIQERPTSMQSPPQQRPSDSYPPPISPSQNNFDELDGGKYNKKEMKNFMKMLKNKNKNSTKQVVKNRNTKKNKH
jgi:hypothetical protein